MENILLSSIITLSSIGILAAVVLFFISKKFYSFEDPKIDQVEEILPGTNCGGCGYAGCRHFAQALVKATDLATLNCPVGGPMVMVKVADLLGLETVSQEKLIAVLRCNGSSSNVSELVHYDGAESCLLAQSQFAGQSLCQYGCFGLADCVNVCKFNALEINAETGLPVVNDDLCTACGACVDICPRDLFELRPLGPDKKRVFVACMNQEKGALAKKYCKVACIGCMKCVKATESKSVSVKNNLSYIDTDVDVVQHGPLLVGCCPTGSILGVNIQAKKPDPPVRPKPPIKPKTENTESPQNEA